MKTLTEYFNQKINEAKVTTSNEERQKELEDHLKNKKYADYVAVLNKMLEDPKAAALIKAGFGGELGDLQLKMSEKNISVGALRPTQKEIDITQSIKWGITMPDKNIDNYNSNPVELGNPPTPLVTFRGNYIIDGHHRWSQTFAFNPDAKMKCIDYDGEISPIKMLKAMQGAIAAVKASNNKNKGKLPVETAKEGANIFDDKYDKKTIIKYVKDNAADDLVDWMNKYDKDIDSLDKAAEFIADNMMDIKANNYPESFDNEKEPPGRELMPQTDKGGPDENDKKSSLPNVKGSALNKLRDGKIVKGAL